MQIKNINETEYFTSLDGCKITELFGIPTNNLREVSTAYAIIKPNQKTKKHSHQFIEIYFITKGKGIMYLNENSQEVKEGDSILINKESYHCIENTGEENLELYCICVPSFTEEGTTLKE